MIEPEVDNGVTLTDLSLLPLLGVDASERMFNFCYINIYVLVLAIVNNLIYLTLPLKLSWFSLVLFITNHSMYYNNLSHAFNNCNLLSAHLILKNVHTVKKLFRFPILVKNKPFTSTKLSNCLSMSSTYHKTHLGFLAFYLLYRNHLQVLVQCQCFLDQTSKWAFLSMWFATMFQYQRLMQMCSRKQKKTLHIYNIEMCINAL
jgi:hypothetical protein